MNAVFHNHNLFPHPKKNQKSASICVIGLSGVSTFAFICCFITPWAFAGKQDRLWIWKAAGLNRGFPHGASGKEPTCISRRCNEMCVWSLGWEEGMAGGHGNPLQCFCVENPMDREAWWATVHRVTKSWTQLKRLSMHIPTSIGRTLNARVHTEQHPRTSCLPFICWVEPQENKNSVTR